MSMQASRLVICFFTIFISVLGFFGLWYRSLLFFIFFALLFSVILFARRFFSDLFSLLKGKYFHKIIFLLFIFTLFFHLIGTYLPETGFDALWYHLPLVKEYSQQHSLVHDEKFYQSLYPQYADGLLVTGFATFGFFGSKSVSFLFFLLLIFTVYEWFKKELSNSDALLGTLVVSLFQVVAWQSSSAYVDLISAVFFLWGVTFLLDPNSSTNNSVRVSISALSVGVFLGSKFVNLGFLPMFFVLSFFSFFAKPSLEGLRKSFTLLLLYWLLVFLVAVPWYLRVWYFTGSLIYPIGTVYAIPVITQMGVSGWREWLMMRATQIWRLPIDFFFRNDGYTSPLLLFFLPLLALKKKWSKETIGGVFVGVYGLLFWFFFPPPSTRYVLGSVIFLWLIVFGSSCSGCKTSFNC